MPNKWNTILSLKEKNGLYKIDYSPELDKRGENHKSAGALYLLMLQYPELIEDFARACASASEKIAEPFNDILHERP